MTPQEVLGISPGASLDEAEVAYHQLLRRHHPDLHQASGPEALAAAEARTRALNSAIEWLRASSAPATDRGAAPPKRDASTGPDPARAYAGRRPYDPTAERGYEHQAYARQQRQREQAEQQSERRTYERQQAEFRRYQQQQYAQQRVRDDEHDAAGPGGAEDFVYDAKPIAICPFCEQPFEASAPMKEHVWWHHGVKLDARRDALISPRFSSRFRRWFSGLRYLSPWFVLPFNVVVALIFAYPARNLDLSVSYWMFAVAMGPTIVLFTARGFRRDK